MELDWSLGGFNQSITNPLGQRLVSAWQHSSLLEGMEGDLKGWDRRDRVPNPGPQGARSGASSAAIEERVLLRAGRTGPGWRLRAGLDEMRAALWQQDAFTKQLTGSQAQPYSRLEWVRGVRVSH